MLRILFGAERVLILSSDRPLDFHAEVWRLKSIFLELSAVRLLNSEVVMYLSWSWSVIFFSMSDIFVS